MVNAEAIERLLAAGAAGLGAQQVDGLRPHLVVPDNYMALALDDKYLDKPHHIVQNVEVYDPDSFIEYFQRFKTSSSRVFVDIRTPSIVGILDYHEDTGLGDGAEAAAWCSHRVQYKFRPTREWEIWFKNNGTAMTQLEFAQFIEDNLPDVINPLPAAMKEMTLSLEAKRDVNYTKAVNLQNGTTQFTYHETVTGSVGGTTGQVEVPREFTIRIAPFEGADKVEILCRFRYKLSQQALSLRYEMWRPNALFDAAVEAVVAELTTSITENPVTFSKPL